MSLFRELALAKGFSGGGGNPNRVQTIEGTLNNPFGTMTVAEVASLQHDISVGNANAMLAFALNDFDIIGALIAFGAGEQFASYTVIANLLDETHSTLMAGDLEYHITYVDSQPSSFELFKACAINGENGLYEITDLYTSAEYIPTTLTIIWHPLPDQS